jgi:hypothetical protein
MTTGQLEQLIGEQVPRTREMQLVGDRLFHLEDGAWRQYPDYPTPKEAADGR